MRNTFLFFIVLMFANLCFSQQKLDSILPLIQKTKDSVIFRKAYEQLRELRMAGNIDTTLSYAAKLLPISKDIGFSKGTGHIYKVIGNVYNTIHEGNRAYDYYDSAAFYYQKSNYLKGLAFVNSNISAIENKRGNLESAISHILQASLYFERINDSASLSTMYNNMGNIYHKFGDPKLTKKYYKKAIDIKRVIESDGLEISLNNMAQIHIDQKENDSAKVFLKEALEMGKKHQNRVSMAASYFKLGSISLKKKEYEESKKYYDSGQVVAKKGNNRRGIGIANLYLGIIATKTKNYVEAQKLLPIARTNFKDMELNLLLLDSYKYSASLDSARGDFLSAFAWQKRYQVLADDNTSKENAKKIELAENRYKSEIEKLRRIDEQEKKQLKDIQALFKYRIFTYVSIGVSILLLIFSLVIIKSRIVRNQYIRKLNDSNQLKDKLFSIISHDLKNEIHGLDSSLNLLMNKTIPVEEFQEIIPLLANSTHQTSILLTNLLNWSKSQMKELKSKPITFNIGEVISDKFSFFKSKAEFKNVKLKNELSTTLVFADKDMFAIVSQNLIANAIKFCNTGDTIKVTSVEKEEYYEICFEDTGVGIPQENLDKLFTENTFTTNGTQNETGTGLGLRICKELTELNKGKIEVFSVLGKGSKFCISLPKA